MIRRMLLLAALAPVAALAQLQLYQFDGTTETPVNGSCNMGSAGPGDTIATRFRIRNLSMAAVVVNTIGVTGSGFTLSGQPLLPNTVAPQNAIDFRVSFTATTLGSFTGSMSFNGVTTSLRASAIPGPTVSAGSTQVSAGGTIDFGKILSGTAASQTVTLTNPNSMAITVSTLSVSGAAFSGPAGVTLPIQLAPGASVPFQISFQPQTAATAQGTLTVDQRTFNLTGLGLNPPLPKGTIVVATPAAGSSTQVHISVALAAASGVSGTGTLTMQFQPAPGLADDPAIQFMTGSRRQASVSIAAGSSTAQINGQSDI